MSVDTKGEDARRTARLEAAFERELLRSRRQASRLLSVVFLLVAAFITVENGYPAALFFYLPLLLLWLLVVGPYRLMLAGRHRPWHEYVAAVLFALLFVLIVFIPNPLARVHFPPHLYLKGGNELYLMLLVTGAVFTYSPRLVVWTGIVGATVWSLVTLAILLRPESFGDIPNDVWAAMGEAERVQTIMSPYRIDLGKWGRLVIVLLVMSGALAVFVSRSRQLVYRQADAERERANLSRYFSPNMVEQLAQSDDPLRVTKSQEIAVLFADLVGFTSMSENRTPEEVIHLLRGFHGRMQNVVFDCDGTLDKYIGDAVMATFGTPTRGHHDATNALRCVLGMRAVVDLWNEERAQVGEPPIRVGIGAHYGQVVMGDIGGDQRLEFAVLGDTVNVASRIERLTRTLGATAVISAALVEAARAEGNEADALVAGFTEAPPQAIRGREAPVTVYAV